MSLNKKKKKKLEKESNADVKKKWDTVFVESTAQGQINKF